MSEFNEWLATTKEKVIQKSISAKEYVVNHKGQIMAYGIATASVGTSIVLGCKLKGSEKMVAELNKTIGNQKNRIDNLVDLCLVKDEFFDYAISEGMRNGSPWCAQQMAYKR